MRWRIAGVAIAGVVGMLAFPPFGLWPLAFVSVAGLSLGVRRTTIRQSALLGTCYGLGLFLPLLHWSATYVGWAPWFILAFSQSWFTGLLGAAIGYVQRGGRFVAVLSAALWVTEEAARSRIPFGGFPWGRWAFSQADSPLRWFAWVGGAPAVSFVVAFGGCLLADALSAMRAADRQPILRTVIAPATSACSLVLAALVLGAVVQPGHTQHTTTIAAIQGDVPDRGLNFNDRRRQVLDNHVAETLKLADQIKAGKVAKPSLVLWPENASDIDPFTNADAAQTIQQAADALGVPILVGALLDGPGPDHVSNSGIVWQPSSAASPGAGELYTKRHPVPFGEYIPLRSLARKVTNKVDLVQRDMVAGKGNGLLTQTPYPVGDVICFEVAYDGLVRSSVKAGAQLLVVQTNNATFGHSGETYQQLAMSRLRAVEFGRTVVQVATSGKSAIINPDGQIQQQSGALFTSAILLQQVSLSTTTTLATKIEAELEWGIVALGVAALIGVAIARKRRSTPERWPAPTEPIATEHKENV